MEGHDHRCLARYQAICFDVTTMRSGGNSFPCVSRSAHLVLRHSDKAKVGNEQHEVSQAHGAIAVKVALAPASV